MATYNRFVILPLMFAGLLTFAASPYPAAAEASGSARATVPEDAKAKAEAGEISKAVGKKMHYHETKHFTWCTSVAPAQAKTISSAAEKAYKIFAKHIGTDNWRPLWGAQKAMGVVCANKRDFRRYVKWYANKYPVWNKEAFIKGRQDIDWFPEPGARPVFVTHLKPHDLKFVTAISTHLVGHMIVDRWRFHRNFTPAWLRESAAAYFEGQVIGKIVCGCYDDAYGLGTADKDRRNGIPVAKFRGRSKKQILKKRLKNMKGLAQVSTLKQVTFDDLLKGYAVVHWMMSQKGMFSKYLRAMKKHWPSAIIHEHTADKSKAQEKAFQEVFKLNFGGIDAAVSEYVSANF